MRRILCQLGTIAAVVALTACQPSTSSGPPSTLAPAATPVEPAATPAIDLRWTEVAHPDPDPGWGANGLLVDAAGFLLFGAVRDAPQTWSSLDGMTWTATPLKAGDDLPSLGAVSPNATVLVAVTGTSRCAHPVGETMWRRLAGQPEWAAVPFDDDLFCAGGFPHIAASDDAFVVAGTGTGEQPFAWRSVDGLHWFDVTNGLTFDAPPALLASTPMGFIEVGRGSITDMRVLGDSGWLPIAAPPVPPTFNEQGGGLEPTLVLSTRAGLFAFFEQEDPLRWSGWLRGPDGSWAQIGTAGIPIGFVQGGTTIRGLPYLFVFDGRLTHLITSSDLQSWVEVMTPDLSQIGAVAEFDGRVLLWGDKDPVGMGVGNPGLFVADLPAP